MGRIPRPGCQRRRDERRQRQVEVAVAPAAVGEERRGPVRVELAERVENDAGHVGHRGLRLLMPGLPSGTK